MQIKTGTLEERIIRILESEYPITIENICKKLKLSEAVVHRCLKKLAQHGIVELEPLPDKIYVRLTAVGLKFIGIKATQRKPVKHTKKKMFEQELHDDYPYMYA
jgi:predicted transcriptional regulator